MVKGKLGIALAWILLGILGVLLSFWISPYGYTVTPDSVYYLMGAESIRRGLGFVSLEAGGVVKPITHWPPMYSLLLAFFSPVFVNGFFFGLTVFMTSFLIYRATRSFPISIFSGVLVATSPILLKFSSSILTETVFNSLVLLLFYFMIKHREEGGNRYLILMALIACIVTLTRYAGLFLVLPLLYYALRKRIGLKGVLVALSPIATYILWKVYILSQGGQETRHIMFHPPSEFHLKVLLETFVKFFSFEPSILLNPIVFFLMLISLLIIIFTRGNQMKESVRSLMELSGVFIVSYLLFLVFSITFIDFYTLPDDRILSILYPFMVILIASYLSTFPLTRALPIFLVLAGLNLYGLWVLKEEKADPHMGYNGPYYWNLETLEYVRDSLPPDAILYSNGPDLLWYYTRRPASMLPKLILPVEKRLNPQYDEEMQNMINHLRSGNGYIVILAPIHRVYLPGLEELFDRVPIQEVKRFKDGVILVIGDGAKD